MPRTITITFDDGTSHVYQNAPDNITPADVEARAAKDFGKKITNIDGGRKAAAAAPETATPNLGFKPELGNLEGMPDMTKRTFRAPSGMALRDIAEKAGGASEMYSQLANAAGRGILKFAGAAGDIGASAIGFPTSEEVAQTFGLKQTPAQYAPAEFTANVLAPEAIGAAVTPALRLGAKGINVAQDLFNPRLNALASAAGAKGPEIVNALRASTSGVETAGQAATPAGSVPFSQFTKELEKHAADVSADAARTQDALLAARSNMAEGRAAEGSRTLADAVAAPNEQKVGQDLIAIAEKEKRMMKDNVINPAFKKAEDLAGDRQIDISNVTKKAADVADSIDPDAATVLSRRLSKFEGDTATLPQVSEIRTAINNAAARAKAKGDEMGFRDLIGLHKELDNAITTSANLTPEAVSAYKDALKTYAEEYAPRFKTGLQFDLFKVRQGVNAVKPENVVDKFFNSPTNTDQFIALYGANPEAMTNARVGIEGMFRDKAIKDGVIDTKAATKFLDDYGAQIDKLDAKGLGVRDKLQSLIDETARVSAPEARIAEVRGAIKGGELPKGPAQAAAQQRATALAQAASPEDLTALRDAVEIARRRGAYENMASAATKEKTGVPVVSSEVPSFLNLPLRISTEVYRRVAGKLNAKMSQQLGELLSDPTRLNEAADMIEKALAMKARQGARANVKVNIPPYAGAVGYGVNALAPPSQNSLANQTGQ